MKVSNARWLLTLALVAWIGSLLMTRSKRLVAGRLVKTAEFTVTTAAARGALSPALLRAHQRVAQTAESLDPLLPDAVILHAGVLFLLKKPELAATHYQRSLALEQRSEAFYNLGRCYRDFGQTEQATESFENAVRLDSRRYRELRTELSAEFQEHLRVRNLARRGPRISDD